MLCQRSRQEDPLLLSAGQLSDLTVTQVPETDTLYGVTSDFAIAGLPACLWSYT